MKPINHLNTNLYSMKILLELRVPGRSMGSAFADKLLAYFHTTDSSLSSYSCFCVPLQQDGYEATARWERY